jgi:hypothetical protein
VSSAVFADALTRTPAARIRFGELVQRLRRHREELPPDVFAQFLLELATSGDELECLIVTEAVDELDDQESCDATAGFVDLVDGSGLDRRRLRSAGRRLERMLEPRCPVFAARRFGPRTRGRARCSGPPSRDGPGDDGGDEPPDDPDVEDRARRGWSV